MNVEQTTGQEDLEEMRLNLRLLERDMTFCEWRIRALRTALQLLRLEHPDIHADILKRIMKEVLSPDGIEAQP